MAASKPNLTIILMVDQQRERSAAALRCLLNQTIIDQLEILLVDFSDAESLPGSDHPSVRLQRETRHCTFGQFRAEFVAQAAAPIVAFYEDHVTVGDEWAQAIVRAHDADVAGVGGEIHNANADQGISRVSWVLSYGLWLPPIQPGAATLIPGNNSSYKRDVLLSYGESLPTLLEIDLLLQQRLIADGYILVLDPSIKFAHNNETTIQSLCKGYYWFTRCLGSARVQVGAWKLRSRLVYLAASPLLPFVRTFKTVWYIARHRPEHLATVLSHFHWLLLANGYAVIGQATGILPGSDMAQASSQFLDFELNEPRGACNTTVSL